ncbi:MAG: methylmalonyl Co-A mutase-associated GTPase MeaB, partial [Bacteroidia bacterium]
TIVVSVPESGDDIQTLKSGIMEIADIFVVNKADREGASIFASHLKKLAHERADNSWETPVVLTQAIHNVGLEELIQKIDSHFFVTSQNANKRNKLLAEKAYKLIQSQRMSNISIREIEQVLEQNENESDFNLFSFVEQYFV